MIELNKKNIERKSKETSMWKIDLSNEFKKVDKYQLDNSDYKEVYFSSEVKKQLYEIGYIKPYYLFYTVPAMYVYKNQKYRIIDSMVVNEKTGQLSEQTNLTVLGKIFFSIIVLSITYMFINGFIDNSITLDLFIYLVLGNLITFILIWLIP